jgi:hypothetical protein
MSLPIPSSKDQFPAGTLEEKTELILRQAQDDELFCDKLIGKRSSRRFARGARIFGDIPRPLASRAKSCPGHQKIGFALHPVAAVYDRRPAVAGYLRRRCGKMRAT